MKKCRVCGTPLAAGVECQSERCFSFRWAFAWGVSGRESHISRLGHGYVERVAIARADAQLAVERRAQQRRSVVTLRQLNQCASGFERIGSRLVGEYHGADQRDALICVLGQVLTVAQHLVAA